MNHLSHEELIDCVYSEGAPQAVRHLEDCRECGQARRKLEADLDELPSLAIPEPEGEFEQRLWSALSPQLVPYQRKRRFGSRSAFWLGLGMAGACAALLVAAFYAGRFWEHGHQPRITASSTPVSAPKKIVVVLLSDHLERSERLLVQLKHSDADDTEMLAPMRDEARDLLAANRKFRQEAEKSGDPDLTKALDRLEQLLTQLANQPGGLNPAAISKLQDEMNAEGLLFEVRVLRSRLPDRHTSANLHLKGGAA
jgi:hypothetical protein